nr:unnamed protein product [Callosobruchus analis]
MHTSTFGLYKGL